MDIKLPTRKGDKKNKNRKYGRKARTFKHRIGQFCEMRNCVKLAASRRYDESLKAYVSK